LSSGGSGQGSHHAPLLASSTSSSSNTPLSTPYPPAAAAGVGGFGGPNGATPAPPPPPFPPPLSPTAPFFQMPPPTRFSLLPFSFSLPFTSLLPSAGHQIGVPVPASQPFPPQPYSPQQSPTSPPPHAWAAASAAIPPPPFLATHAGAAAAAVGTPVNAWASQPYSQPIGTRVAFSRSPTLLHFTIPPQRFSFKALPEIVFALCSFHAPQNHPSHVCAACVAFGKCTAAADGDSAVFNVLDCLRCFLDIHSSNLRGSTLLRSLLHPLLGCGHWPSGALSAAPHHGRNSDCGLVHVSAHDSPEC
ncbi:hypothetical protein CLOM_g19754, partial [Closterium sp. NIES-68]